VSLVPEPPDVDSVGDIGAVVVDAVDVAVVDVGVDDDVGVDVEVVLDAVDVVVVDVVFDGVGVVEVVVVVVELVGRGVVVVPRALQTPVVRFFTIV